MKTAEHAEFHVRQALIALADARTFVASDAAAQTKIDAAFRATTDLQTYLQNRLEKDPA